MTHEVIKALFQNGFKRQELDTFERKLDGGRIAVASFNGNVIDISTYTKLPVRLCDGRYLFRCEDIDDIADFLRSLS